MPALAPDAADLLARAAETIRATWGYDRFRPLQAEAIRAAVDRRDSLVVMPTGGGKSLCYQVPPLLTGRTDVVASPLVSLMNDQCDALRQNGYAATAIHGGKSPEEIRAAEQDILTGQVRLAFVAPERLMTERFLDLLRRAGISSFAIDEAHCISHWGHDFRPEYRRLGELRRLFPGAGFHAYTATATPRVQQDIVRQLGLREPAVLVGVFDRPNLTYRIVPRDDVFTQSAKVLKRHAGQAAIVYCISRRDTEELAHYLASCKFRAAPYHAGLSHDVRRRTQDDFARERLDVVVATVAFGMGIDRSNVRCVLHAAMPKSIEHYQQETGRAGRDGLPAECVLLYSAGDALKWESLLTRAALDASEQPAGVERAREGLAASLELLKHMRALCSALRCRHRAISEYFGQAYERTNCGACDLCLGEHADAEDATVPAQKILSCVARVQQRFGVGHVVDVLLGAATARVGQLGHDRLSTYGLMKECGRPELTRMVHQLLDQRLVERSGDEYPVLTLNAASWEVMRGQRAVHFMRASTQDVKQTRADREAWRGVDRGLFDRLRALRKRLADERNVPPFVVFGDETLRDLARRRPATREQFLRTHGVGRRKLEEYGDLFLAEIAAHGKAADSHANSDPTDIVMEGLPERPRRVSATKQRALDEFAEGRSIEDVMESTGRSVGSVVNYLCTFIEKNRPANVSRWVADADYAAVTAAIDEVGDGPLRPIFEKLGEATPYETIKIVQAHRRTLG